MNAGFSAPAITPAQVLAILGAIAGLLVSNSVLDSHTAKQITDIASVVIPAVFMLADAIIRAAHIKAQAVVHAANVSAPGYAGHLTAHGTQPGTR